MTLEILNEDDSRYEQHVGVSTDTDHITGATVLPPLIGNSGPTSSSVDPLGGNNAIVMAGAAAVRAQAKHAMREHHHHHHHSHHTSKSKLKPVTALSPSKNNVCDGLKLPSLVKNTSKPSLIKPPQQTLNQSHGEDQQQPQQPQQHDEDQRHQVLTGSSPPVEQSVSAGAGATTSKKAPGLASQALLVKTRELLKTIEDKKRKEKQVAEQEISRKKKLQEKLSRKVLQTTTTTAKDESRTNKKEHHHHHHQHHHHHHHRHHPQRDKDQDQNQNQEQAKEDTANDTAPLDTDKNSVESPRGEQVPENAAAGPAPTEEQDNTSSARSSAASKTAQQRQQEYLQQLANQRKQKQLQQDAQRDLEEKKKQKTHLQAMQRLEASRQQRAQQQQQQQQQQEQQEEESSQACKKEKEPIDVPAMVARLSKLKEKDVAEIPEARDFLSWKKRQGIPKDQKVFSVTGFYPVIRQELESRGWFFNADRTSPFFDLKWSLRSDELKGVKLQEDQYVNHFFQNRAITTKVGLIHNLRSLVWHQSVDIDTFFPRAYDLNEPKDMEAFIQDFKYVRAEGFGKELVNKFMAWSSTTQQQQQQQAPPLQVNAAMMDILMNVLSKKLRKLGVHDPNSSSSSVEDAPVSLGHTPRGENGTLGEEDLVDDPLSSGVEELVTDLEWEILGNCGLFSPGTIRSSCVYKKKQYVEETNDVLLLEGITPVANAPPGSTTPSGSGTIGGLTGHQVPTEMSSYERKQQRKEEKLRQDQFNKEKKRLEQLVGVVLPLDQDTVEPVMRLLWALEKHSPQFHLNGGTNKSQTMVHSSDSQDQSRLCQNIWIVKPAGMSRGRGIKVFQDLDELLGYADVENHKECQWIAQKYIENPLLCCKRKFDIRQWVLVTSWNPLTVWFYDDCYCRFSSQEFQLDDLSDQYIHLTNNSIQKYCDKFEDVYTTEDGGMTVEGNMWHSDTFREYLAQKLGRPELWETKIHPRMKEIVKLSLESVQDMVLPRKNSCELFGYDFMFDENFQPWLIEVNSSPACDYSTAVAKRYVETGLAGIIKVIVDHREYEQHKRQLLQSGGNMAVLEEPDTGRWVRIVKNEFIPKPATSIGLEFQVKGKRISRRYTQLLRKKAPGSIHKSKPSPPPSVQRHQDRRLPDDHEQVVASHHDVQRTQSAPPVHESCSSISSSSSSEDDEDVDDDQVDRKEQPQPQPQQQRPEQAPDEAEDQDQAQDQAQDQDQDHEPQGLDDQGPQDHGQEPEGLPLVGPPAHLVYAATIGTMMEDPLL